MNNCCYDKIPPVLINFSGSTSDCGEFSHDIRFEMGDFVSNNNDALSSFLMQLGTNRSNGRWWGEPFLKSQVLGAEIPITFNSISEVEEILRRAIDPLIQQNVIDELDLNTFETVEGYEIDLIANKNGDLVFSTNRAF